MPDLTAKQELFCVEYLKDLNATQAAIRAGYSQDTARSTGSENLTKPAIQEKIAQLAADRNQRLEITADMVLRELHALSTVDLSAAFADDGTLKSIHDIPIDVRKAIASIETLEEFEGSGQERTWIGYTKKIKLWDRTRTLEMLGRHIALFNDRVRHEHTGKDGGPIEFDDDTARASRMMAILTAAAQRRGTDDNSDLA